VDHTQQIHTILGKNSTKPTDTLDLPIPPKIQKTRQGYNQPILWTLVKSKTQSFPTIDSAQKNQNFYSREMLLSRSFQLVKSRKISFNAPHDIDLPVAVCLAT
jgi:hypothetical protein